MRKGMIRAVMGLLIAIGAMGPLETNPDSSILIQLLIAAVGLWIFHSGVIAMQRDH